MKKILLILLLITLSITLTACSSADLFSNSKGVGGMFKSVDFGEKWQASNTLTKKDKNISSINSVSTSVIQQDFLDNRNLYLGTQGQGIYFSHDSGATWRKILSTGYIYDLALDYKNNGVIYASLGNKIIKTLDGGKKWKPIYTENRKMVSIMAIATDPKDNLKIYFGTSGGEIYKTTDGGESWKLVLDTNDEVREIVINPQNPNIIYVGCLFKGIYKTANAGGDWKSLQNIYVQYLKTKTEKYRGVRIYRKLVMDQTQADSIIFASDYGLLKSIDGGNMWSEIPTLISPNTPQDIVKIKSLVINPKNNKQIYYGTEKNLYRTFDGGQTWLTSQLPSSKIANELLIDNRYENILYLGLGRIIKP